MGAVLNYKIYDTDDKKSVSQQWGNDVEHADSSPYCGEIGLLGSGLDFGFDKIYDTWMMPKNSLTIITTKEKLRWLFPSYFQTVILDMSAAVCVQSN